MYSWPVCWYDVTWYCNAVPRLREKKSCNVPSLKKITQKQESIDGEEVNYGILKKIIKN